MKHHYRAGMIVAVLSLTAPADERVRPTREQAEALRRRRSLEGHGHGWPVHRGRADLSTGPKTRDIWAPEEMRAFLWIKAR